MELPEQIEISGYICNIEIVKEIKVSRKRCYGIYDAKTKTIYLDKNMDSTRMKEIFIHEFMHFLEDIYRLKFDDNYLSTLALGILQLVTNKKIKWTE